MGIGQNMSVDTFGGWRNHFYRMERWKDRCLSLMDQPYRGDFNHDGPDFMLAYFVWCHSFRDWLIESKAMEKKELYAILNSYPEWKKCADIANRCRHYNLERNPTDKDWSIGREYDFWPKLKNESARERWWLIFGDEKTDLASLIRGTFTMWTKILESQNLNSHVKSVPCFS